MAIISISFGYQLHMKVFRYILQQEMNVLSRNIKFLGIFTFLLNEKIPQTTY